MEKKKFEDDGRTIADMDAEGLPGYRRRHNRLKKSESGVQMTKPEKKAFNKALFFYTVKILSFVAAGLLTAFLLMWLWLR